MATQFADADIPNHSELINKVFSKGLEQQKNMQVLLVTIGKNC